MESSDVAACHGVIVIHLLRKICQFDNCSHMDKSSIFVSISFFAIY